MIALLIASLLMLSPQSIAVESSSQRPCRAWASTTTPPLRIRVLIGHRVVRVPFRLYVERVVSSEWQNVRDQLRLAGAVAVKQYAWVKTMHPRHSRFGCFDVHADTRDQLYRVKTPSEQVKAAVAKTWTWRVLRDGKFVSTGYRTGAKGVRCARDVDRYHLKARSAKRCVIAGWSAKRVLATYYAARVKT